MDIKLPVETNGRDVEVTDDSANQVVYIAKSADYDPDLRVYAARVNAKLKMYKINAEAKVEDGRVVIYLEDRRVVL